MLHIKITISPSHTPSVSLLITVKMPKASSNPTSDSNSETKPYSKPTPKKTKSASKPKADGDAASKPSKGWTREDKLALLNAVLATASPEFKKIAVEVFAGQGRNANQVSCR